MDSLWLLSCRLQLWSIRSHEARGWDLSYGTRQNMSCICKYRWGTLFDHHVWIWLFYGCLGSKECSWSIGDCALFPRRDCRRQWKLSHPTRLWLIIVQILSSIYIHYPILIIWKLHCALQETAACGLLSICWMISWRNLGECDQMLTLILAPATMRCLSWFYEFELCWIKSPILGCNKNSYRLLKIVTFRIYL